jgi:hypothetical protein
MLVPEVASDRTMMYGSALLGAFIAFGWVHFDSRVRGILVGPALRIGVAGLAAVFVPVYVIRSRGWSQGLKSLARFLVILLAGTAMFSILSAVVAVFYSAFVGGSPE